MAIGHMIELADKRVVNISVRRKPLLQRAVYATAALAEEAYYGIRGSGPMPENRFILFAQGRSGSTLMTSQLNSHPQIHCHDELLQRPRLAPLRFIDNVARTARSHHHGFHVKCDQLFWIQRNCKANDFLDAMEDRNMRIIYLWRRNFVQTCFSVYYAKATGIWHFRSDDSERPNVKVRIEPRELLRLLDEAQRFSEIEREALAGRHYCELNYEDDLLEPAAREAAMNRVQDYLGVDRHRLTSRLQKSVKAPLNELIENYDELKAVLRQSSYAHMLAPNDNL